MATVIQVLGENLAEEIRREHDLTVELDSVKRVIDALIERIRTLPDPFAEWVTPFENTGEQTLVRPYVGEPQDPAETVVLDTGDVPTMRMDVGDTPLSRCPGPYDEGCVVASAQRQHYHTADGAVHLL